MDVHTALAEAAVEFQSEITHSLRNIITANFANGVYADTVVSQRELRRFYYNVKASVEASVEASVNSTINEYEY